MPTEKKNVLTRERVERILAKKCSPNLRSELQTYTTIEAAAAELLVKRRKGAITFSALRSLDESAARHLAGHKGPLNLGDAIKLSEGAAEALARHQDQLSLKLGSADSKAVSEEALARLARHPNLNLEVHSETLSAPRCAALAQQRGGYLRINLSKPTASALRTLIVTRPDQLDLDSSFHWLTPENAATLGQFQGGVLDLSILRDKPVGPGTLKLLSEIETRHRVHLSLSGLHQLTPALAKILAQKKGGRVSLNRLEEIDVESARALAQMRAELILGESESFSPCKAPDAAIRELAQNLNPSPETWAEVFPDGSGIQARHLRGLPGSSLSFVAVDLSDATCEALAKYPGSVNFSDDPDAMDFDDFDDIDSDDAEAKTAEGEGIQVSAKGARLLSKRRALTIPRKRLPKEARAVLDRAGSWQGDDWSRR
jgi:hypothetical protein